MSSLGRIFGLPKNKGSSSRNQDEQIARSFQEGVYISQSQSMPICDCCGIPIHKEKYVMVEDDIYHERCYGKFTDWRKCPVCLKIIEEGCIFKLPFWGNNICNLHRFDGTPQCSICEKYQNKEERYIKLPDDRILCRDCHSTAIFNEDALESLQECLHRFFKKKKLKFHNDIPIFLVDKNDIENQASLRLPDLDLSELTIGRAIENRPDLFVKIVKSCELKGSEMKVKKKKKRLTAPWILIPYGLPRLVAGELLAQEMMHIWMQSKEDYKYFNPEITKGICKAMAYECLFESWNNPIDKSDELVMKSLREFRELEFRKQHSRIYGYGFTGARTVIQKFGVENALKRIYKKTNKGRINATMIMEEDFESDEYDYSD